MSPPPPQPPSQRPQLSAWASPAASTPAVSGGGTDRQAALGGAWTPGDWGVGGEAGGTIPQPGCGVPGYPQGRAGQGRVGPPPARDARPTRAPRSPPASRRDHPLHQVTWAPPPAPPSQAHPSRAPDHPASPPQAQLQPRPGTRQGRGELGGRALRSPRPCAHRRAHRATRPTAAGAPGAGPSGRGKGGAGLRGRGSGLKGP